ncbi:MAG: hypothetical protein RB191_05870 [Terriglobia bacterium]|nr:hypothetical protein [Terriglobia bacterium]
MKGYFLAVLLSLVSTAGLGQTPPPPDFHPSGLRTIYIDAPPDAEPIKTEIVRKLHTWGEIAVVYKPEQADLILELVQSGKLNLGSGSGNRGSVVLKDRRTGEDLWSRSRGGGWSIRGFSNTVVGRKLGDDLIQFLSHQSARNEK